MAGEDGPSWCLVLRERFVTTGDVACRMLRAILNTAVTDGLIAKNPCQVRGAGRSRSAERPVASVAEAVELLGRGGHANLVAPRRHQHATEDRDRATADAPACCATGEVARLGDRHRARARS